MRLSGYTAWSHEDDFTDTMCAERLLLARERQRLIQVQGRCAGFGGRYGLLELGTVRFKRRGGRGQRIGAHQHHAIGCSHGFQISSGPVARFVHQRAAASRVLTAIQAEVSRIRT